MHLAESLLTKKCRPMTVATEEFGDKISYEVVDHGTLVQRVAGTFRMNPAIKDWGMLSYCIDNDSFWMVRPTWLKWFIVVFWRISLAMHYLKLGLRYAVNALRGR